MSSAQLRRIKDKSVYYMMKCPECSSMLRPYVNLNQQAGALLKNIINNEDETELLNEETEDVDIGFDFSHIKKSFNEKIPEFIQRNNSIGIMEIGLDESTYDLQKLVENLYLGSNSSYYSNIKYSLSGSNSGNSSGIANNSHYNSDSSNDHKIFDEFYNGKINALVRINPKKESIVNQILKESNKNNNADYSFIDNDEFDVDAFLVDSCRSNMHNLRTLSGIKGHDSQDFMGKKFIDSLMLIRRYEIEELTTSVGYYNHLILPIKNTIKEMKNILI